MARTFSLSPGGLQRRKGHVPVPIKKKIKRGGGRTGLATGAECGAADAKAPQPHSRKGALDQKFTRRAAAP